MWSVQLTLPDLYFSVNLLHFFPFCLLIFFFQNTSFTFVLLITEIHISVLFCFFSCRQHHKILIKWKWPSAIWHQRLCYCMMNGSKMLVSHWSLNLLTFNKFEKQHVVSVDVLISASSSLVFLYMFNRLSRLPTDILNYK